MSVQQPKRRRRNGLRSMSLKKRRQMSQYQKVRGWVQDRAGGLCEAQISDVCSVTGVHAHHIQRRSQGGPDEVGNLLWTCAECHSWIHANPAESFSRGLLRRPGHTEEAS